MFNSSLETFIGSFSFILLFLIMIFYWFQAIFPIIPKFNLLVFLITMCANLNLIILLVIRWFTYKHFPLSNLYESLIFLSWSFTLIQLLFIKPKLLNLSIISFFATALQHNKVKKNLDNLSTNYQMYKPFENLKNDFFSVIDTKKISIIVGTILSPIALFTDSFATFSLPKNMQTAQALVPALQSNWLMMHVTVMMLSYTALLFGSLLAISFLIVDWFGKKQKIIQINICTEKKISTTPRLNIGLNPQFNGIYNIIPMNSFDSKFSLENRKLFINNTSMDSILKQKPVNILANTLDNLSYRILGIGFPLLTVGILSGAVWANEAWGSYWSWDPKETWAFITWLVFAIYLHGRIIKGWQGRKPAIIASLGFFVVWVCYLGVNILGTGLHSYGWLK